MCGQKNESCKVWWTYEISKQHFCFILGRFSDDAVTVGFENAVSQTVINCLLLIFVEVNGTAV